MNETILKNKKQTSPSILVLICLIFHVVPLNIQILCKLLFGTERKCDPHGGIFHWPVIFIVAVQNETGGSEKMARAGIEENQYGNISAALIGSALLFRGHRGATISK